MNRHVQQYQKGIVVMIMHKATLIFPHQLFESNPALHKDVPVFLVGRIPVFKTIQFPQTETGVAQKFNEMV